MLTIGIYFSEPTFMGAAISRTSIFTRRDWINRAVVAFVFIYFGFLKLVQLSPAEELVVRLQTATLPFFSPNGFVIFLGIVEVFVGSLFFFKRYTMLAVVVCAMHMGTTFLPFIFLPDVTWYTPGVPTLTGQYILKNVVIIALVYTIFTDFHLEFPHAERNVLRDGV